MLKRVQGTRSAGQRIRANGRKSSMCTSTPINPLVRKFIRPKTTSENHFFATTFLTSTARGNPDVEAAIYLDMGPIPVRTGEPAWDASLFWLDRAYPRSHGETPIINTSSVALGGLSPFARGNLCLVKICLPLRGPIPVRTGEPTHSAILPN